MRTVNPQDVTEGSLIASDVINDEPDWLAGQYSAGSRVAFVDTVYEALTTTSDQPDEGAAASPPTWAKLGVSNRWRMFRGGADSVSRGGSQIDVDIATGRAVSVIAMLGLTAASVRVIVEAPEGWEE